MLVVLISTRIFGEGDPQKSAKYASAGEGYGPHHVPGVVEVCDVLAWHFLDAAAAGADAHCFGVRAYDGPLVGFAIPAGQRRGAGREREQREEGDGTQPAMAGVRALKRPTGADEV
jgi:hypothetical protein